jgi:hypothetical protein
MKVTQKFGGMHTGVFGILQEYSRDITGETIGKLSGYLYFRYCVLNSIQGGFTGV